MGLTCFFISSVLLIFSLKLFQKNPPHPVIIFLFLWTFIFLLSSLGLYNIYKPSNEAYFLLLLMVIFFSVGCFFGGLFIGKKANKKIEFEFNEKLFISILVVIIILNVLDGIIIFRYLRSGVSAWQIRGWAMAPFGASDNPLLNRRSLLEESLRTIFLNPVYSLMLPPIAAYYFFHSKTYKNSKIVLIVSLLTLFTGAIVSGGGRLAFLYFVGSFILAYLATLKDEKKEYNTKIIKKYMKVIIILCLLFVIIFTSIRSGSGSFIKQAYTYFALPPTLLSIWLPIIKSANHTYGFMTLFGFHSYFFRVLKGIGFNSFVPGLFDISFDWIMQAETFKQVGYGVASAFVTPVYELYLDGGYLFVIIASLVFGWIVSVIYNNYLINRSFKSFVFYTMIVYGVFLTFIRLQISMPSYLIPLITYNFLFKKKEVLKNE